MKILFKIIIIIEFLILINTSLYSQQDPQYTQYMYNTMSVNPAYAGSINHLTINTLARIQWVDIDGAPETQTLSFHSPIGYSGLGIGLNLVNDKLGPAKETYFDSNISITIRTSATNNLAFGLKLGGRIFNVDWSKGNYRDGSDRVFNENIKNKFLPTVGAGIYYYSSKFYVGLSAPNFLKTSHYDDVETAVSKERFHYFLIGGYVFQLNDNLKFKPAFLTKLVEGSPLSLDVSANFLFNEKFTAGLAYRWDDAISGLLGFQLSKNINIGYAYDLTTSNFGNYNSGTHEVMLKFEFLNELIIKSPRFF